MNIADEARFVRRYECTVLGQIFAAEFDIGFLQPQRRVSHAHNHAAVELIAVHTGISGVRVDTDSLLLRAGEILLIPAGAYHANDMEAQQGERFCFRIYLPGEKKSGSARPLTELLSSLHAPLQLTEPALMPILACIREEMQTRAGAWEEMIQALLAQCFILLFRLAHSRGVSRTAEELPQRRRLAEERMKKIDSFFSRRYMQQVTLGDLAEELYLSTTHTNRILRARYGRSFTEKLRDTRLYQARILLEQTDYSANRLAQEVGYVSAAAFYSAFRAAFGMTPSEYRKLTKRK